jgi:hypothetical protein
MVETTTTLVLTVGSLLLLGYWFRYTCLLILSAKTTRDYAGEVAEANQLSFLEIQARLRAEEPIDLDNVTAALDRDYARLMQLMRQAGGSSQIEDRMVRLNYRFTRLWCRAVRPLSSSAASSALDEMSMMISHFANALGERASAAA